MIETLLRASLEGAVLAVAVWLLLRVIPRMSPAVKATLWWCVAAKFVIALLPIGKLELAIIPAQVDAFVIAPVVATPASVDSPAPSFQTHKASANIPVTTPSRKLDTHDPAAVAGQRLAVSLARTALAGNGHEVSLHARRRPTTSPRQLLSKCNAPRRTITRRAAVLGNDRPHCACPRGPSSSFRLIGFRRCHENSADGAVSRTRAPQAARCAFRASRCG